MNELRFENAFTAVPPAVHMRVTNALAEVKTMKKTKPVAALVLAAVLTLALAGAAYAAIQSGVLDYLFASNEPSESQKEMVQPIGTSHVSNGATATVTDAVFDGRELSVGLQFDAQQNMFVLIDHVTINGVDSYVLCDDFSDMWLADPFTVCEGIYSGGFTATIDRSYFGDEERTALAQVYKAVEEDGRVDCSVGLRLLVPKGKLQAVDIYGDDTAAMWKAVNAAVAAGETPVSSMEPYEVLTGSAALGDGFNDDMPMQLALGDADLYAEYANMTVLDSFSLDFSLSASGDGADPTQAKKLNATINDGRVHISFDEVRVTPLATDISLSITPEAGGFTNEDIGRIYRHFAVYDEMHKPIPLQKRIVVSNGASLEEQPDGKLVYKVNLNLGPLTEPPARILLVPFNDESSAEEPLWEYAIPVSLPQE
jgi:hypothetical protein